MEDTRTRLTEEYLVSKGFQPVEKKGYTPGTWYSKKPTVKYYYEIWVQINNYPETNSNCGIVGLHEKTHTESFWSKRERKMVERKVSPSTRNIAWNVWDTDRLERIYESLTNEKL